MPAFQKRKPLEPARSAAMICFLMKSVPKKDSTLLG